MTTSTNLCRLCVDIFQDSKSLYDENGCGNELYDITFKYFHPQIVNMEESTHLTAICLQCWRRICDFAGFQTSVQLAQVKLQAENQGVTTVKIEQETKCKEVTEAEAVGFNPHDVGKAAVYYEPAELPQEFQESAGCISLPKLEIMDVDSDDECEPDDAMPVSGSVVIDYNREKKHESVDDLLAKWIPIIKCVACPESFPNLTLLEEHFRQHHPNAKFSIVCCSRELNKRAQIKDHLLLHNDPDAFKCHLCDKSYANRQCLRQHMIQAHPEYQRFVCEICGTGLNTKGGLKCHYTTVHSMDMPPQQAVRPDAIPNKVAYKPNERTQHCCEECGKVFHKESSLQKHVWNNHKLVPKHKCSICGARFRTPVSMREHVADVHHHRDLYACVFCPKTFSKLNTMFQHRKRMHPNESNRNYYYKIDDVAKDSDKTAETRMESESKEASTSAKSQGDIARAGGYVPAADDEVLDKGDENNEIKEEVEVEAAAIDPDSEFSSDNESAKTEASEDLGNVHQDSNDFQCNLCRSTYSCKRSFRIHIAEAHPGNLTCLCKICGKVFNTSADRRTHIRDNHQSDGLSYKCYVCSKSFMSSRDLREHVALNHHRQDLER